jgi:hypothetical protein
MKSIVEKWLAATGLGIRENHLTAKMLQDFGDCHADMGIKLVGQTGNEERDLRHDKECSKLTDEMINAPDLFQVGGVVTLVRKSFAIQSGSLTRAAAA